MPRQQLDLTNPIVQNGRATSYLEALLYEIFAAIETAPVEVTTIATVATVDLTKGSQFNIDPTMTFSIDIIGVEDRVSNRSFINIANPAGAYDLTDITSDGVTVLKTAGSSIAILGIDEFMFIVNVPSDDKIVALPFELEPV